MAIETERIVRGTGQYVEDNVIPAFSSVQAHGEPLHSSFSQVVHDISPQVQLSRQLTTFYPHYSDSLANWHSPSRLAGSNQTSIEFTSSSTLEAAHRISLHNPQFTTPPSSSNLPSTKVGVLCSTSPKKPKAGNPHSGEEQVDSIIRSSSLISCLLDSSDGSKFYEEHNKYRREDGSGLHDHGMLYSPGVVVIRNDAELDGDARLDHVVSLSSQSAGTNNIARSQLAGAHLGQYMSPYTINVLSAVPVSAGVVRTKHVILPEDRKLFEDGINSAMKERMARTLKLFEERGDKALILGAFGCGCSSQNAVEVIASIWAELLVCGDRDSGIKKAARFKDVFDKVVFAVPGKLFRPFQEAFEMRVFEEEVMNAATDD